MQPRSRIRHLASIAVPDGFTTARGLARSIGVLAGLELLLALLVASSVTAGLDAAVWPRLARLDRPGPAHATILIMLRVGQFSLVWTVVLVVSGLVSLRARSWRPFLGYGGTMIVLDALMVAFKYPLGRSFPHTGRNVVFGSGESYQAFPSGHAAHATIAVLVLAAMVSRWRPPAPGRGWWGMHPWSVVLAGLLATGAGLANVVLGYHWLTDVIGGWLIGLMMFLVASWLQGQGGREGAGSTLTVRTDGSG